MSIMKNEDYYSIEQNHNGYDVMRDQQAEEYEYLKDKWLEENYNDIRYAYEMDLIDNGYAPYVAENTNDGRDVFVNSEFKIYLENKGT